MDNTFVIRNISQDEIWVCYPTSESEDGRCDRALVWNYLHKTWTVRDLPATVVGTLGPIISGAGAEAVFEGRTDHVILSGYDNRGDVNNPPPASNNVHIMDEGFTHNGDIYTAFIERKRIGVEPTDFNKYVKGFYPWFDPDTTTSPTITIKTRGQDLITENVSLETDELTQLEFEMGYDYKVELHERGRVLNYRIETTDENTWNLAGIGLDVSGDGRR